MVELEDNGTVKRSHTEISGYQAPEKSNHGYPNGPRSILGLLSVLGWSIYIYIVAEVLLVIASVIFTVFPAILEFDLPETDPQIALLGWGLAMTGIVFIGAMLFSIILTCRFTYRAMRNLHTINSPQAIISPGWAVGWYFIPFANLVKPAQAMSQIYHGTLAAVAAPSEGASPISRWWVCWLLSGFLSNASGRIPEYNSLTMILDLCSATTGIVSALALLGICRTVAHHQELLKHGGVANVFA